jgi:hypothetical protein
MAFLQVVAEKRIQNITANCYNHYFRYDTSSHIEEVFTGLSLYELSGLFITFIALSLLAVWVFIAEMCGTHVGRLQLKTMFTNHDHNESKTKAAGSRVYGVKVEP